MSTAPPVPLAALLPDLDAAPGASIGDVLAARARDAETRAQAAIEQARAAELAAARDAGYQAGLVDGGAAAAQSLAALRGALEAGEQRTREAVRDSVALDTTAITDIALAVARWVLGAELTTNPGALVASLDRVVAGLAAGTTVEVATHPDTVTVYQAWAQEQTEHQVRVVPDPALHPGEALARVGDGGTCRVSIEAALRRAATLLGTEPTAPGTSA